MLNLANQESDASDNSESEYADCSNGSGVGTGERFDDNETTLEEQRKDFADLAVWMSGLKATDLPLDDPHSLCNGRAFAELLHEIDKDFFDEKWLETIPGMRSTSNNVVKRSNIRKLWRKMSNYFSQLNRKVVGSRWIKIGDRVDGSEETDLPVAVDLGMAVAVIALIGKDQAKYVQYCQDLTGKYEPMIANVARMVGLVMLEIPEVPQSEIDTLRTEDLERQDVELRSKQREAEERVLELEAAVEHLQSTVQKLTEENDALRTGLQEKLAKNQQNASGDVVELKVQLEKFNVEVERMREAEMKANTELADMEELLRERAAELETCVYALTKAKEVIDELEERFRSVEDDNITQPSEQMNRLLTSAAYEQVVYRSAEEVMCMRAQAGADTLTHNFHSSPRDLRTYRQAEENVIELEAALKHSQSTVQKLTEESDALRTRQKELNMLRSHLDSAKSDVEEWRAKANQYQADAELAKKREKEVKELQGQVKSLTSRLEHHVKTATINKDNQAEIVQLRSQIDTLKANNVELNVALESKKQLVEQLELQLIQYKDNVKELRNQKEDLIAERNSLENQLAFKDSVTPRSLHESMFEASNLSFEPISEKTKSSLEIENKRLAERIQELEALESQNGVLEEQNLVVTKQKEDLEQQIAELQEKLANNQQNASGDVMELKVQLKKVNVEVAEERVLELEAALEHSQSIVQKLTEENDALCTRQNELNMLKNHLDSAQSNVEEWKDAILVIDGKKVHVNKSILSYHSDYFREIFSLNDKNGKLNEIPIEGISVDDFNLLLGPISSEPVFPNDETVEKLLELATRFKMSSVIDHCKYYLLFNSKIENEKMMWIGEKYEISDLLEKAIFEMDTMEKAKKWKQSPEYSQLSDNTKTRVFERLI